MIDANALTDEEWEFVSKEAYRVQAQLLRARAEGVAATLTLRQWLTIINEFNGKCAYCQRRGIEVMEHLISLSLGGGTTAENCVPACEQCNHRKGKRTAHIDHETRSMVIHPLPRRVSGLSDIPTHWLSVSEAARIAHVTPCTIYEWARQGLRHSRVETKDSGIEGLAKKMRYSIDPEALRAFLLGEVLPEMPMLE